MTTDSKEKIVASGSAQVPMVRSAQAQSKAYVMLTQANVLAKPCGTVMTAPRRPARTAAVVMEIVLMCWSLHQATAQTPLHQEPVSVNLDSLGKTVVRLPPHQKFSSKKATPHWTTQPALGTVAKMGVQMVSVMLTLDTVTVQPSGQDLIAPASFATTVAWAMGSVTTLMAYASAMMGLMERTAVGSCVVGMECATAMANATVSRSNASALGPGVEMVAPSSSVPMIAWAMESAILKQGSVPAKLVTLGKTVGSKIVPCIVVMANVILGCRFVCVKRGGRVPNVTSPSHLARENAQRMDSVMLRPSAVCATRRSMAVIVTSSAVQEVVVAMGHATLSLGSVLAIVAGGMMIAREAHQQCSGITTTRVERLILQTGDL